MYDTSLETGAVVQQDLERDERDLRKDWNKEKPAVMNALRKILSYGLEGIALSTATYVIPGLVSGRTEFNMAKVKEILAIGLVAAAVFALLDIYAPRIGAASRIGAGIAIGAMQVGGLPFAKSN